VFDEGFHGPGQVGPEVKAVALAVLDEGIGDAAEFASPRRPEEEGVLGSDF